MQFDNIYLKKVRKALEYVHRCGKSRTDEDGKILMIYSGQVIVDDEEIPGEMEG